MADPEPLAILKQGAAVWNQWRQGNPSVQLFDLHTADLASANLSGALLGGVNLIEADLRGVDFTGADLRQAGLARAKLSGAHFGMVHFFRGKRVAGQEQENRWEDVKAALALPRE